MKLKLSDLYELVEAKQDAKVVQFLRKYYKHLLIFFFATVFVSLLFNTLCNVFYMYIKSFFIDGTLFKPSEMQFSISTITDFSHTLQLSSAFTLLFLLLVFGAASVIVYKFHSNFASINKFQKGDSRFATVKEIQKQYRAVPLKDDIFEGKGGIPVVQYKDKVYIDDSAVNNLIVGTTRSGKGETFVFPTIDIYSRASKKSSLIITDPKGELVAASKATLENRGYDVFVLNLLDTEASISYNLLELVKEAYVAKDYSTAQQYAYSLAFSLYHDENSKDPFWNNASTDLCTALILALCEHCKHEQEKITMHNVAVMLSELSSETTLDEKGQETSKLDVFFNQFDSTHPARLQFQTVKFASQQTRASILANTAAKLSIFTLTNIARMTSTNTIDLSRIGFGKKIKGKTTPFSNVKVTFPNDLTLKTKANFLGLFELYHDFDLQVTDELIVEVDKVKTTAKIKGIAKGIVQFELSEVHEALHITQFTHYTKPVALFFVVPDYDRKFDVIVTMFIDQLYKTLSRIASNVKKGKCFREVVFLLDEFGNFPAISQFSNILTVCLGRNIKFSLIIQAYAQLEKVYGKDWKTIDGNTNNTIYFLTDDDETAEKISKKCGERTITVKSRSGKSLDINKSKTESIDTTRLILTRDVMSLKLGESIVIRTIKRQDNKQRKIKQYPIHNREKTASKFRYEYLSDSFPTDVSINDLELASLHKDLDLNTLKVDYDRQTFVDEVVEVALEENAFDALIEKQEPAIKQDISLIKKFEEKQIVNNLNQNIVSLGLDSDFEEAFGEDFASLSIDEVIEIVENNKDRYTKDSYSKVHQYLTVQKNKQ